MHRPASLACLVLAFCLHAATLPAFELDGQPQQGGLMFGRAAPGSTVRLDGMEVPVAADGRFAIGFGRDDTGTVTLVVSPPQGPSEVRELALISRQFDIERVDGLPPSTVTPDPEALERIREEAAQVGQARELRDGRSDWKDGFAWPAHGRLSGFYGSQRILNGEPRNPHYGVDVAAPEGSPVTAPADGLITLAHPDMYYSGGTVILDHGAGLSSTFLHLSEVLVKVGQTVHRGDLIGRVGMTGRATGPHLDWRMNWLDRRVDPLLVVQGSPDEAAP